MLPDLIATESRTYLDKNRCQSTERILGLWTERGCARQLKFIINGYQKKHGTHFIDERQFLAPHSTEHNHPKAIHYDTPGTCSHVRN